MKNIKKTAAIISALLVIGTTFSCGKAENDTVSDNPIVNSETSEKDNTSNNEKNEETSNESSEKDESSDKSDNSKKENNTDNSSVSDKKQESSDSSSKHDEPEKKPSENNTNSKPSTPEDNSGNTTENTPENNAGVSSSKPQSGNSQENNNSVENIPPTEPETKPEVVYTAEITLGSTANVKGNYVTVNGSKVSITAGGEYYISGSVSDGQIHVKTTEKVKLHLDGVSINCSTGPAIFVEDAKRFTIRLMEGTTNSLKDSGNNKAYNGVIASNDTVEIRGKGTLNITAGNAHGITSDDDVVIENGTININSVKSGIRANDDITINGGNLTIKGGTNGLKSEGTIHVNGGYSVITGGTNEEKSSVLALKQITYKGGQLFAVGNLVTAPTSSVNPYIIAGFTNTIAAGNNVTLSVNGKQAISFTPHSPFRCVMMLSPELTAGSKFSAKIGDKNYDNFTVSSDNSQNILTLE